MGRLVVSSDHWPDITVKGSDGLERTYPIKLELTYGFDSRRREMGIALAGRRASDGTDADQLPMSSVMRITGDKSLVYVIASNLTTSQELVAQIGLPSSAAVDVREHVEAMARKLEPFVQDCFVPLPAAPSPQAPPDSGNTRNMFIEIDRDVSGVFRERQGSCLLKYTLFSEPAVFRCIIAANHNGKVREAEFRRKTVDAIMADLNSDNLAYQVTSYFGTPESQRINLISAVLKLSFAMHTGTKAQADGIPVAVTGAPDDDTRPIKPLPASGSGRITVINGGDQFEVRA